MTIRLVIFIALAFVTTAPAIELRVMSFNASLNRPNADDLANELADPSSVALQRVAEIVQNVAPDVLLLNEFDHNGEGEKLRLFQENFLAIGQNGEAPITYPFRYAPFSNTGVNSGLDLDNNRQPGVVPGDAFGFGEFPGRFNMAFFSKYPIETDKIRTFQNFLWKDMPGNVIPPGFYSNEVLEVFRLSSKNHCDVPVTIGPATVHFLISHPTPPVFDGSEDRNGRRNTDEIRLWADYIDPAKATYLIDDDGKTGGLEKDSRFVIMGDQNADIDEGDSREPAIRQLLQNPLVDTSITPNGPRFRDDTAIFGGRVRVDYCLPSTSGLTLNAAEVIWPRDDTEPLGELLGGSANGTVSDHRPVVIDVSVEPIASAAIPDLKIERQDDSVVLNWSAAPQVQYTIEKSTDLTEASWSGNDAPPVVIEGEAASATASPLPDPDRVLPRPRRFRVGLPRNGTPSSPRYILCAPLRFR